MAGLTHDLGHGLFSHIYEVFRGEIEQRTKSDPDFREQYREFPKVPDKWTHERSSLATIDAALASLGLEIDMDLENLDKPLKQIGDGIDACSMRVFKGRTTPLANEVEDNILTNRDWIFIKECIYGKPIPEVKEKLGLDERIGRLEPEKEWLYDVVCNRHNGIDVDKVDYFARDARRTQASRNGRINVRVLREVTVAKAKCSDRKCIQCRTGHHYMICYPEKCIKDIRSFFETRFDMHEAVYQHKTTTASTCMLVDILKHADLHYLLKGKDQELPLSRAVIDSEAFCRLKDDTIIENIANSELEAMKPAKVLAERFVRRDLYSKCINHRLSLSSTKNR
jgi:HD superfamily phosphohydrolase